MAQPSTSSASMTPPATPSTPLPNSAKPTRFEFDMSKKLPELQPATDSNSDHLLKLMRERIFQLERENHELRDTVDCFNTIFEQDQQDILLGREKKVGKWSDKVKTNAIEDRYIYGSTGYEHHRGRFPGTVRTKKFCKPFGFWTSCFNYFVINNIR